MQEEILDFFKCEQMMVYTADMIKAGRPSKNSRSDFGQRLYYARERAGLTQAQLADKLGVVQQVVAAWERRDCALKPSQVAEIAQTVGVSSDYLLGISNSLKSKGPIGKMRQVFEAASELPRRQQQKIAEFVEPFIEQQRPNGSKT